MLFRTIINFTMLIVWEFLHFWSENCFRHTVWKIPILEKNNFVPKDLCLYNADLCTTRSCTNFSTYCMCSGRNPHLLTTYLPGNVHDMTKKRHHHPWGNTWLANQVRRSLGRIYGSDFPGLVILSSLKVIKIISQVHIRTYSSTNYQTVRSREEMGSIFLLHLCYTL